MTAVGTEGEKDINKRVKGEKEKEHYKGLEKEFALMSTKIPQVDGTLGGIGKSWLLKYQGDVYPKDFFTFKGRKLKPPRYYDRLYMRDCADNEMEYATWQDYENIKENRKENQKDYTQHELYEKWHHKKLITRALLRRFENGEIEGYGDG